MLRKAFERHKERIAGNQGKIGQGGVCEKMRCILAAEDIDYYNMVRYVCTKYKIMCDGTSKERKRCPLWNGRGD